MRYWKGCRIFYLETWQEMTWKQLNWRIYDLIWFNKLNNCHGPSFQHFFQDRWAALFSWPCRDGPCVASKWWSQVMWHRLHLLWIRGALDWSWMESWKSSGKYRWCSIMFLFPKRIYESTVKAIMTGSFRTERPNTLTAQRTRESFMSYDSYPPLRAHHPRCVVNDI